MSSSYAAAAAAPPTAKSAKTTIAAVAARDPTPVWLDCDPGHDDAIALLLAANSPAIALLGVSAVAGNQSVDKTYANAIKLLAIAGCGGGGDNAVPCVKGQARPLIRAPKHDPGIHGETGLDGSPTFDAFHLECTVSPPKRKGVLAMGETIAQHAGGPVTIIATGALTNVALFLTLFPELHDRVARIVFMGGAIGVGNRHPVAEFNIICDPEAAKIVMESGLEIAMVPLEVTHTAIFNSQVQARVEAMGSNLARMVVELMTFFSATYKSEFGFMDGPPVHDACAVAYVIDPSLFEAPLWHVDVVTGEHLCAGQTVCDQWNSFKKPANCHVCTRMNVSGFWNMLLEALYRCDAISPLND